MSLVSRDVKLLREAYRAEGAVGGFPVRRGADAGAELDGGLDAEGGDANVPADAEAAGEAPTPEPVPTCPGAPPVAAAAWVGS